MSPHPPATPPAAAPHAAAATGVLHAERRQAEQVWARLGEQLLEVGGPASCQERRQAVDAAWQAHRPTVPRHVDHADWRVVVADDEQLLRALVRAVLSREPGVRVVGEADGGWAAVGLVAAEQPDVLVLDYDLGDAVAPEVIACIRLLSPRTRVLLHSARADAEQLGRQMGVEGVVPKSQSIVRLPAAVRLLTS